MKKSFQRNTMCYNNSEFASKLVVESSEAEPRGGS